MNHWTTYSASLCLLALACHASLLGCTPPSPAGSPVSTTTAEQTAAQTIGRPEAEGAADTDTEPAATAEEPAEEASANDNSEPLRITFDDLNCNIQANLVFREWMLTDRAKELDGERVRLAGYILADLKTEGIEEFVLLKNTECKFGPDGQADHLALVKLTGDETANFTSKPIDVIGTLHYKPFRGIDGFTWAIYEIHADAVRPMRR